jgi:hypothetical protein
MNILFNFPLKRGGFKPLLLGNFSDRLCWLSPLDRFKFMPNLVLTNPKHNSANPTEYLGTIRTKFSF